MAILTPGIQPINGADKPLIFCLTKEYQKHFLRFAQPIGAAKLSDE